MNKVHKPAGAAKTTYSGPNEETGASLAGTTVPGGVVVGAGVAIDVKAQIPPCLLALVPVHLSVDKGLGVVRVLQTGAGQLTVEVGGQMRLGRPGAVVMRQEGRGGEEFDAVGIGRVADVRPKAGRGRGEDALGNVPVRSAVGGSRWDFVVLVLARRTGRTSRGSRSSKTTTTSGVLASANRSGGRLAGSSGSIEGGQRCGGGSDRCGRRQGCRRRRRQ